MANELPDDGARTRRIKLIGFGLLMLMPFLVAWLLPPELVHSKYSICFFQTVVGKPCPFCGLTRAYVHAAHGDIASAYLYHPFWWVAVLVMAIIAASSLIDGLFGTHTTNVLTRFATKYAWVLITVIVVFGVYRLVNPQ